MRVHVHGADGAVRTEEVASEVRLGDVVVLAAEERAYPIDDEAEIDLNETVTSAFGDGPGHVVVSRCRKVDVTVTYAGSDRAVPVRPAVRLRRVRGRAIEEFGIRPADAADLVLRLPGRAEDLDLAAPVASIVPAGTCGVGIDLIHASRPQG